MTREEILSDLQEASRIAKAGEDTPLLGGPIGLMWGVLLTLVFGYQYLVVSGGLNVPQSSLLFAWIAFAVIGGVGSTLLGRRIKNKPGMQSVSNKVESYVWTMYIGGLAAFFVGIILNSTYSGANQIVWNSVLPFAFAAQGMAYGVTAKISGQKIMHIASFSAMSFAAISMMVVTAPTVNLIGSIGSFVTIVIPSLISIKQAK